MYKRQMQWARGWEMIEASSEKDIFLHQQRGTSELFPRLPMWGPTFSARNIYPKFQRVSLLIQSAGQAFFPVTFMAV